MAGTEHPNPVSSGIIASPGRPNIRNAGSNTLEIRSMYPHSSKVKRHANKIPITGRNESTLATPGQIPSVISVLTVSFTPFSSKNAERQPIHHSIPSLNNPLRVSPGGPKVVRKIIDKISINLIASAALYFTFFIYPIFSLFLLLNAMMGLTGSCKKRIIIVSVSYTRLSHMKEPHGCRNRKRR